MGNVIYIDVLIVLNIFINYFLLFGNTFFFAPKTKTMAVGRECSGGKLVFTADSF